MNSAFFKLDRACARVKAVPSWRERGGSTQSNMSIPTRDQLKQLRRVPRAIRNAVYSRASGSAHSDGSQSFLLRFSPTLPRLWRKHRNQDRQLTAALPFRRSCEGGAWNDADGVSNRRNDELAKGDSSHRSFTFRFPLQDLFAQRVVISARFDCIFISNG